MEDWKIIWLVLSSNFFVGLFCYMIGHIRGRLSVTRDLRAENEVNYPWMRVSLDNSEPPKDPADGV